MVYVPEIIDYKPFYIQTDAAEGAIDTTQWGMVAKTNPFPALPIPKEPYKNEWLDEDGDDEYNAVMHYEAFEFEVAFYVKTIGAGAESVLVSQVRSFFEKIRNGEFMVFDSYTGLGRRKVRYAGFSEEEYKHMKGATADEDWARAIFKITFKVNDPITRVRFQRGILVEV